jgi:hypothetical protein
VWHCSNTTCAQHKERLSSVLCLAWNSTGRGLRSIYLSVCLSVIYHPSIHHLSLSILLSIIYLSIIYLKELAHMIMGLTSLKVVGAVGQAGEKFR